jgi:hypothetical protein
VVAHHAPSRPLSAPSTGECPIKRARCALIGQRWGCVTGRRERGGLAANLRVAVIDRVPLSPTQMADGADGADYVPSARVSTITPANSRFLAGLGAWDGCVSPHAAPFHRMQVCAPSHRASGRPPCAMRQVVFAHVRWLAACMRPPPCRLLQWGTPN